MTSGTAGYRNAWRSCNTTKDLPSNTKQMLLDELKMQDREETEQIDVIGGRAIDQRFGISDQYFVLDTVEKDSVQSNPSEGYFVFNIKSQGVTGQEYVGVKDTLTNVIAIETMSWPLPQFCNCCVPITIVDEHGNSVHEIYKPLHESTITTYPDATDADLVCDPLPYNRYITFNQI